jgi:hypothetical protein
MSETRRRPGRPSRSDDPWWQPLTRRAIERKAHGPTIPWRTIADELGIPERTLRDYRRALKQARDPAAPG